MAHLTGLDDIGEVKFQPVHVLDANGIEHEFHFRSLLLGDKLCLEAFDSTSGEEGSGYRVQIIGDLLSDQLVLLEKLIEKTRRLLVVAHISGSDIGLQIVDETIGGRIE